MFWTISSAGFWDRAARKPAVAPFLTWRDTRGRWRACADHSDRRIFSIFLPFASSSMSLSR